jgi:hypothetical protein
MAFRYRDMRVIRCDTVPQILNKKNLLRSTQLTSSFFFVLSFVYLANLGIMAAAIIPITNIADKDENSKV